MSSDSPNAKKLTKRPYRESEYLAYKHWVSLPYFLKGKPQSVLLSGYDVRDPILLQLLPLRTQTDFARKFGIKDLGTLTDWNERIEKEGGASSKYSGIVAHVMREALGALYVQILRYGRAKDFKVFAYYVEGWKPGDKPWEKAKGEKRLSKMYRKALFNRLLSVTQSKKSFYEDMEAIIRNSEKTTQ